MKEYQELLAALQVGTRRVTLPTTTLIPTVPGVGPEKTLLIQAGIGSLMLEAGAKSTTGLNPIPEAPNETSPVANRSADPLNEAFDLGFKPAIQEWAQAAAMRGYVAPYRVLPKLINFAKEQPKAINPVLGSRGKWLAETLGIKLRNTEASEFDDRRSTNPSEYREWLDENLDALEFEDRLDAIAALKIGLESADTPLLTRVFEDRRKEIRTKAGEMLVLLADSEPAKELVALADRALKLEKSLLNQKLILELFEVEVLPKWMPKPGVTGSAGPKAEAFREVLGMVPPSHWEERFRTPPAKFLALTDKSEFKQTFKSGIAIAAVNFGNQSWIDETFLFHMEHWTQSGPEFGRVFHLASDSAFDSAMVRLLPQDKNWSTPVVYALMSRKRPFSPRLTRVIFENFNPANWGGSLDDVAYFVDVATASAMNFEFTEGQNLSAAQIDRLSKIIPLRKRLLSSLNPL